MTDIAEKRALLDRNRFSWEIWHDNGRSIVGLMDGGINDDHRPLLVCRDHREAMVVVALLRGLDVKALDGRPIDSLTDAASAMTADEEGAR